MKLIYSRCILWLLLALLPTFVFAQPMANRVPKRDLGATIIESKSLACGDMVFSLQVINNGSGCCYRLLGDNSNPDDCYMNIGLTLNAGEFTNFTHLSGWQHNTGGPAEYTVRPFFGFVPFGLNMIAEFCVEGAPSPTLTLQWNDLCSMEGCTADFVVNACFDPGDGRITGVKYKECGNLPYINQTPISGWTIQLLDSMQNVLDEQVTQADGSYSFFDLHAGTYTVKETQKPGWTSSVPASGQTTITLTASQQRIVNFGNCPPQPAPCTCPPGTQPGADLIQNGSFSSLGGFNSGYTLNNNNPPLQPGQYWVGPNPSTINAGFASCGDHSGSGNMLVVNGAGNQSTTVWCQTMSVAPNTSYLFESWVASLSSTSPANLMLFINNVSVGTGFFASNMTCTWQRYCTAWNSGTNTSVTLCLIDLNAATTGNDFALDDISFRKCASPIAHVTGVVYRECGTLPYINQPVLSGWTVDLLDTLGNIIDEQVTDSSGMYTLSYSSNTSQVPYVKIRLQSNWTANMPVSGVVQVQLDAGESVVQNFGVCPGCSCDSIEIRVDQELGTSDTSLYHLSIFNQSPYCFSYINIKLDSIGEFVNWEVLLPGWTVSQQNSKLIRLNAPGPILPGGVFFPLNFRVNGVGQQEMTVTTFFDEGLNDIPCSRAYANTSPSETFSMCCSSTPPPLNLLPNGDFTNGNTGFLSDYVYDNTLPFDAGHYWVGSDPSQINPGFSPCIYTGDMLVVDGSTTTPLKRFWYKTVPVTPNTTYYFQYEFALLTNNNSSSWPKIDISINNSFHGYTLQDFTCNWYKPCFSWFSGSSTSANIALRDYNTAANGNDFAIDNMAFFACGPASCQASFTITPINNCGLVQLTGTSTGPPTIGYQWYNSVSTPNQQVQLSCGLNTICVTVTCGDGSTSTACQNYVVSDPIPPVALCKLPISLDLDPSCTFAVTPAFVDNGSFDNCPNFTMMVSPTVLPSCAATTVTLTVTDWCGNTSTCTMDIQTAESTPPVINNCPQNQIVPTDLGVCFYTFTPPILSVTDNCDPNPTLNCTWQDPNGTILPITGPVQMPKGSNKIRCKAIDNCGNESAPCNYALTVGDYESPMIICPQNLTVHGFMTNNTCEAVVSNIAPIATDNCPIQSLDYYINPSGITGQNDASGETFQEGVSTVAYVVTDCGGFTNACFFTVTVVCDCDPSCDISVIDISTDVQDHFLGKRVPFQHVNQDWELTSAPAAAQLTIPFPGHMVTHSKWMPSGSAWLSAYLFNDNTTFNDPAGVGTPFVYERTFCVCEQGLVTFDFQFWSDYCGKVEIVDDNGNFIQQLVDNCTTPNSPNNWTTPSTTGTGGVSISLTPGKYRIKISHWNTSNSGKEMGVYLTGSISGSNLVKDDCCNPRQGCFLIRKFEDHPSFAPGYNYDPNDMTIYNNPNYDKPLSGWNFDITKTSTGVTGTYGPTDIQGEYLVCSPTLAAGSYSTSEVYQPGWTLSWPTTQPQNLNPNGAHIMLFGNSQDNNGCSCGTLSNLQAIPTLGGGQPGIPLTCGGAPISVNWPVPGSNIYITGALQCQGTCLSNEWVDFTLSGPNSNITIQSGAPTNPYFAIPLSATWFTTPGVYTLTLQGVCGGMTCSKCIIQFQIGTPIDPCPCDPVDFQSDLSKGFAVSYATTGCVACFSPIALNDCDIVQWSFGGGPIVGTTMGNQTFCYNLSAGTQIVTMTVTRKDSQGNKCDQGSYTQSVNITCGIKAACNVSNFPNPGFSEGAAAGGINSTGASSGWYGPCGEPVVVSGEPGSHDGWTIQLAGNLDSSAVLAPRDSVCIPLDSGTISLRIGIREKGIKSVLHIQLYQGPQFEMNECNGTSCIELAAIDLSALDTGWIDLELPYDIRDVTAVIGFACTSGPIDGVKARVAIFVTTALGSDQGSFAETRSSIQVDNFCMGDGTVSVKNTTGLLPLRIFPNPNAGTFTVELPEAAKPGMTFRVTDLAGRLVQEQRTEPDNAKQTVRAGDLPAGLYFLQVISEGKVLATEKFVKQ